MKVAIGFNSRYNLTPDPSPASCIFKAYVFIGWRGEVLTRGALAPLGGLLPLNGAFKRGEAPLLFFPLLNKICFEFL
jgi:hypothetical protein